MQHSRLLGRALLLAMHLLHGAASATLYRLRWGRGWYLTGIGSARIRLWMRQLCRIVGLEIRVHGAPVGGPALLVANHVSWLDVIALAATAPTAFVAKAEVARWPVIGPLARSAGVLFIKRDRAGALEDTLDAMQLRMAAGRRVTLFPEGTTTWGETVLPFRAALFEAARRGKVMVQPVALRYGEDEQPDPLAAFIADDSLLGHLRRLLRRRHTVLTVRFLPALPPTGSRRALAERSCAAVREALGLEAMRRAA